MLETLANGTRLEISARSVLTTLPCGRQVYAEPQDTLEQAQTAQRLGYGDDVDAMTREHDPLHARLCAWLGLPTSYSLSAAAGAPLTADGYELAALEEAAVLAVQEFARKAGARLHFSG